MGVFIRLWRWMLGQDSLAATKQELASPKSTKPKCARDVCGSISDPRCEGGNCTYHCLVYCPGCGDRKRKAIGDTPSMADIESVFHAAPAVTTIVRCDCGTKNRVLYADFGRKPICGKCKKTLRLPS